MLGKSRQNRSGFRIFGVGAAKTGTHSIASIFEHHVSARHEADAEDLIRLHLDRVSTSDDSEVRRFLIERDQRRRLKIDASQVNIYLIEDIEALFPNSRFILTVRPPLEWLRSMLDDSLRRAASPTWLAFRDYRFGSKDHLPPEEEPLRARGLYSLAGYLSYWRNAIERTRCIPDERLIVLETSELASRSLDVAQFCGIEGFIPKPGKAHAFANPTRFGVLNELDFDYLVATAERICGDMSRDLFPNRSIAQSAAAIRDKDTSTRGV